MGLAILQSMLALSPTVQVMTLSYNKALSADDRKALGMQEPCSNHDMDAG